MKASVLKDGLPSTAVSETAIQLEVVIQLYIVLVPRNVQEVYFWDEEKCSNMLSLQKSYVSTA